VASSVDAVVFVARGRAGERRVEAIAEVDGSHREGARSLFARRGDRLVPVSLVRRAPRRHDATHVLQAADDPTC
jgi:hypothetical protein